MPSSFFDAVASRYFHVVSHQTIKYSKWTKGSSLSTIHKHEEWESNVLYTILVYSVYMHILWQHVCMLVCFLPLRWYIQSTFSCSCIFVLVSHFFHIYIHKHTNRKRERERNRVEETILTRQCRRLYSIVIDLVPASDVCCAFWSHRFYRLRNGMGETMVGFCIIYESSIYIQYNIHIPWLLLCV